MRSILIIKIGAIGDVVMALPMLQLLREKYPHAHITWVVGHAAAPLVRATSLVDQLLMIEEAALFQQGLWGKCKTLIAVWKELFARSFDLIITAHPDPRYRLLTCFTRKREHRFFDRKRSRPIPTPGRYHLHEYLRLVDPADPWQGPVPPFPSLALPIPTHSFSRPLVILAPGGAKNAQCDDALRRWPIEHYAALAKQLADHPVEIALTGAATDSWVEPHFQDIPHHNFIGKLPLLDLVTLLKQASLLITHDSGPLHLAKLVACPTIALFGPTNPYEKLSASENIHLFWEGGKLPCSPCYDGKNYARCSQNVCLSRITPEAVLRRALVAKKRESALP